MRVLTPGTVLGVGLGGFADGILLHQIAQWHSMASAVLPPTTMHAMQRNMMWDGVFHAVTWMITVTGVFMLWHAAHGNRLPQSRRRFTGELMLGWGGFNLVEGIVDHHVLELHHVRDLPMHVPLYDWLFLAFGGLGFLLIGWTLSRSAKDAEWAERP